MFRSIKLSVFFLLGALAGSPASAQTIGGPLSETCDKLGIPDGCELISEAAKMLGPSYAEAKATEGKEAFRKLGYDSEYFPAKAGMFQPTVDVFFVSKAQSNRLFIVITGTESPRDWIENAKFSTYSPKYKDGQFYVPPAHAGFRRGMLGIVNSDIFRINEFDTGNPTIQTLCENPKARNRRVGISKMASYLCEHNVADGTGRLIETVIVGHSRGSGIGQVIASIVDGYELSGDHHYMEVKRQENWPLELRAMIGFAPPYAIHDRTDRQAGIKVPPGIPSQWEFLASTGIAAKTVLFVNDRDVVPLLNLPASKDTVCGVGRQFGHRYLIDRTNRVTYQGTDWGKLASLIIAHGNAGYVAAVTGGPAPSGPDCTPSE